jgi:Ser/Thr protein kinase RdoA (MazF antagonist)
MADGTRTLAPRAGQVAEVFGLARPAGDLVPLAYGTSQTWTLDTRDGRVLVKHVEADDWRDGFARAMTVERRALGAGISMACPLPPVGPAFGYAADLDGVGLVRAYEWIDGRPLAPTDDVADWLGGTLARLHGLERTAPDGPEWYRTNDGRWQAWLHAGQARRRPWAPALRRHLPDVLAAAAWVEQGFARADDHVLTHCDVEPWNVLVSGAGPVLVDWDSAGPDSAGLEFAHVAMEFAGFGRPAPDADVVRRTVRAYAEHGGVVPTGPDVLVRRVGLMLGRLAGRLRMSLGEAPSGPHDLAEIETRIGERLAGLTAFTERIARYAAHWR